MSIFFDVEKFPPMYVLDEHLFVVASLKINMRLKLVLNETKPKKTKTQRTTTLQMNYISVCEFSGVGII